MMRIEFKLTEARYARLIEAAMPIPYLVMNGTPPACQQNRVNVAWAELGKEMGFDSMSVKAAAGKGDEYFTADISTEFNVYEDGDQWCAVRAEDFTNIQECDAGFGDTPCLALEALIKLAVE